MNKSCTSFMLFIGLFFFIATNAQNQVDSLPDKSYKELKDMYYKYVKEDSILSKKILRTYLKKAKKVKDTFRIAEGYMLNYYNVFKFPNISYFDSVINMTQNNPSKKYPAYAHFRRAQYFLYLERDIEKTINDLKQAKSYSNHYNNNILSNRIDYLMAIVRSEHLGEKKEAIPILKKCAKFYASLDNQMGKYNQLNALSVIAGTFISLQQNDSAQYYSKLGYDIANRYTDKGLNTMKYFFILKEGINQYHFKNYTVAIDSIRKALPQMIKYEETNAIIDSYFYLAKSYYAIDHKEKALLNFEKTDSILEILKSIPKYEYVKTYEYLKNHYATTGNIERQVLYLNKLNTVLDNYLNDKVFISKKVKEDYDIPFLLEEQKAIIKKLGIKNSNYIYGIAVLFIALLVLGIFAFYQNRKKRLYRIRFEELINTPPTVATKNQKEQPPVIDSDIEIKVPPKHVNHILEKLDEFEKDHRYLHQGISIQSIADGMNTNVKYLSQVINYYKKKKFTSYINELRIAYAVKELKNNTTLRKYTIKAIANEMGYSTTETFTSAFYRQVGIKLSYYIKELEKSKNQNI
ncbi:helix-turn-helix domain-containing protein [Aquimarina sp. 2201CG1-2-11]|uniref:helix-turn-helix domain-containing protein n=1 Tax=Aquimarina discodermiae TaxID=3231043 RepID=UPI00346383BA